MNRFIALAAAAALGLTAVSSTAQTGSAAHASKSTAAHAPKAAAHRLDSEARGLALGAETVETVGVAQLDIAARVLTGKADCEFNQSVSLTPSPGQPGHFKLVFKGVSYIMVPEETTTGAVRLLDRKAGIVWLQIPVKSMLMNSKIGQRMVDGCQHSEQRAVVAAVSGAAATLAARAAAVSAASAPAQ